MLTRFKHPSEEVLPEALSKDFDGLLVEIRAFNGHPSYRVTVPGVNAHTEAQAFDYALDHVYEKYSADGYEYHHCEIIDVLTK